ncbi:MAG TPA: ABC transporter substrate-binding protein [Gemmatimonadaceae bacterium]|nr:ABC transporter substrate-binding protein [Gemmatimonadaceae bacterium]
MSQPTNATLRVIRAAALLLTIALIGACRSTRTPAEERIAHAKDGTGDVVIGVAWPWAARKEVRFGEGLQMAVDSINGAGGVLGRKLRLLKVDDKESVEDGELVAQQLADNPEVVAVIGHLQSYVTVPAAAIYDYAGVLLVAPTATDPDLTAHHYPLVFRTTFTDHAVGRAMASFAAAHGYRRIGIYYIRSDYGRNLANAFEEGANVMGLSVPVRQSYDPNDMASVRSFALTFEQWKGLDLDAIFVAGEVPSAARAIVAARAAGLDVPILGSDAMASQELISVAGAAAEGVVVPTPFHPDEPEPGSRRFTAAFEKRYGVAPDAGSALGYDAVRLLATAIMQAHSTVPTEVASALHHLHDWRGVTGTFSFDELGNLVQPQITTMIVRDDRFAYLGDSTSVPMVAENADHE